MAHTVQVTTRVIVPFVLFSQEEKVFVVEILPPPLIYTNAINSFDIVYDDIIASSAIHG